MKILASYNLLQPLLLTNNALFLLSYLVWAKQVSGSFEVNVLKNAMEQQNRNFEQAFNELISRDLIEYLSECKTEICARKTDCMQLFFRITDNGETNRTTPQAAKESYYVPFP